MAEPTYEPYRPAVHPAPESPVRPASVRRRSKSCGSVPNAAVIVGFCVAIWAISGGGYFWPIWVMLGVGLPALMRRRC